MDKGKVCKHFLLLCLTFVAVARSDITVERRKGSGKDDHLADWFSNPSCKSDYCGAVSGTSGCAGGSCCTCQCLHDKATYLAHSKKCEVNSVIHRECEFKFAKYDRNPLTVVNMTKKKGNIKFEKKPKIDCNTDVKVAGWSWQDITGLWKKGNSSIFDMEIKTSGGGKELSQLKWDWSQEMNASYFGLIIKFHLNCGSQDLGCVMMKIAGKYTYKTVPSVQTTVKPGVATLQLATTAEIPITNQATNQVTPNNGANGQSEDTTGQNAGQSGGVGNTDTRKDSSEDDKQTTSRQNAVVLAVGIVAGLFGALLLICAVYFGAKKYRRKQTREKRNDKAAPMEEIYEDPVYSKLEDVKLPAEIFDNPTYEVDAGEKLTSDLKKRPPSFPLPPIPGQQTVRPESVYQGLIKTPEQKTFASPSNQKERDAPNLDVNYENPPQQNISTSHPPEYDNSDAAVHRDSQKPLTQTQEAEKDDYLIPCESIDTITDSVEYNVLEPHYQVPKPAGEGISEPDYLVLEDAET